MAHKIRVSFLGEGETLPAIVHAVLKDCVIPPENIFLSDKDTAVKEQNLKQNLVMKRPLLFPMQDRLKILTKRHGLNFRRRLMR